MANELTREQIDRAWRRWDSSDYLAASEATALFAMARAYLDSRAARVTHSCLNCEQTARERDTARSHAKAWKRLAKGLRRDLREACNDYDSSQIYLHNAERDLAAARAALGRCREVMALVLSHVDEAQRDLDLEQYWLTKYGIEDAQAALRAALKEEDHV